MEVNGVNLTRAKRISGWMNDKELEWLARTAKKSNFIIEIGSYYGRSTMALADNTDGIVISVDPYKGVYETENRAIVLDFNETVYQDFLYNMSEHLENGKVKHFRDEFKSFGPSGVADFIFIDGDHSYEICKRDIEQALLAVNKGIIAGHDWGTEGFKGVEKAVKELLGEPNVIETIWWIQR